MKIKLSRSGGFAAGLRVGRPAAELDTASLSAGDAARLEGLVAAAASAPVPAPTEGGDLMSYTITVERDGHSTVLKGADGAMSPQFADLLAWLQARLPE